MHLKRSSSENIQNHLKEVWQQPESRNFNDIYWVDNKLEPLGGEYIRPALDQLRGQAGGHGVSQRW